MFVHFRGVTVWAGLTRSLYTIGYERHIQSDILDIDVFLKRFIVQNRLIFGATQAQYKIRIFGVRLRRVRIIGVCLVGVRIIGVMV